MGSLWVSTPETQSNFYSKMNDFECLSYMSYIYTGKHNKEDSSGWKGEFSQEEYPQGQFS